MVIKLNLINSNFSHHRLDNSVYFFRNDYGSHLSEKSFHKPSKGWNFVHIGKNTFSLKRTDGNIIQLTV